MLKLKRILVVVLCVLVAVSACSKPENPSGLAGGDPVEEPAPAEDPDDSQGDDDPSGDDDPGQGGEQGEDDSSGEDDPDSGDGDDDSQGEGGGQEDEDDPSGEDDGPGTGDPYDSVSVLDAGISRPEKVVYTPQHPDWTHEVEYNDFFNSLQDYLDYYQNVDYVCAQGGGTAFPIITNDSFIRFYQGKNAKDGGSYIRIRSHNGAKLLSVQVGTAGKTTLAFSVNGKAAKSETTPVDAGGRYTVTAPENCDQITIYCMGTSQSERWEMNYIKVNYQGGFVESDFQLPAQEYGPLVQLPASFTEDFETGFPQQGQKPSYYKYGQTDVGRDNLKWSTWYGCISWQQPIQGGQSVQLRTYQQEQDYDQSQFGYLKGEFFVKDLTAVEFDYVMSEYFMRATISYCEFGSAVWQNPQEIKLEKYADREQLQHFSYSLDGGTPHDAKIKIEISEDSAFPSRDHYDFKVDNVCFICGK